MRICLQRVLDARVLIDEEVVGRIGRGYLLLVGVGRDDQASVCQSMAEKIARLRLFPNETGRFDRSLLEIGGHTLVVSQFTLYGDARKGRRPHFLAAAPPDQAAPLCERFAHALREVGVQRVETGRFGADMRVELTNDGPVTLMLDSDQLLG